MPDFVCCAVKSSKGRDQGGASSRLSSFLFPPLRSSPPGLFPLSSRLASPPGRRFPSRRSSRLTSPNTSTPRRRFPSLTQPTIVSTSVSSTRRGECSFEVYFFSNVPIQFHRLFRNAVSLGTKHVFPGEPSSWPRHNHARATPGEALAHFTTLFCSFSFPRQHPSTPAPRTHEPRWAHARTPKEPFLPRERGPPKKRSPPRFPTSPSRPPSRRFPSWSPSPPR